MTVFKVLLCMAAALLMCAANARTRPESESAGSQAGSKAPQTQSTASSGQAAPSFAYDASQPLQIQDRIVTTNGGVAIHDITYASVHSTKVSAYLVAPEGKGPFAAVLFGHWGNGTRAEFLPEAIRYAKAGVVSLLPDYPWDRSPPDRRTVQGFDQPASVDREIFIQVVLDLRRGLDLLLQRPDVDHSRVAYVGHSFGAQFGAILATIDTRIRAAVLMAGVPETAEVFLRSEDPDLVVFRQKLPAQQLNTYVQVMGDLDALRYTVKPKHAPLLLQFAKYEQYFRLTAAQHYAQITTEPKRVLWYDADHELNDPQALLDRFQWLKEHIGLSGDFRPYGAATAQ